MIWPGSKRLPFKTFVKQFYRELNDDAVGTTSAALAYYGMLSLFPFLLFLVSLAGLLLDQKAIGQLLGSLQRVAPGDAVKIVGDRLTALQHSSSGGLLTIGIVAAVWSASGGVVSLMQALNRAYDVKETRAFWKTRGLAILVTIGVGIFAVISTAITFAVPVLGAWIGGPFGTAITWLRLPVAALIMITLWSLLYYILPNIKPRFQLITPGSIIGAVLWVAASWGFSEYVRHSRSYEATYGAIGGVIILLVWMWISSLVILLGAELNKLLTPKEKLQHSATGEKKVRGREKDSRAIPNDKPEPHPA